MFTQAAACTNSGCTPQDPLYDYATDVEPQQGADLDRGLQLVTPSVNGCLLNTGNQPSPLNNLLELPVTETNPQLEAHKWLSPAIPTGFSDVVLDGTGELDLWTQTINGGVYGGKICAWLFVRTASGVDAAGVQPRRHREPHLLHLLEVDLAEQRLERDPGPAALLPGHPVRPAAASASRSPSRSRARRRAPGFSSCTTTRASTAASRSTPTRSCRSSDAPGAALNSHARARR